MNARFRTDVTVAINISHRYHVALDHGVAENRNIWKYFEPM